MGVMGAASIQNFQEKEMKIKMVRAWAVFCKNGSLNWIDGIPCFYTTKQYASDYAADYWAGDYVKKVEITVRPIPPKRRQDDK